MQCTHTKKTQTSRPQFTVITAHTTVLMTAQLQHTIQQGTVLVIFPLILQSPPLCWRKWGETAWQHTHSFEFLFASSFLIVFFLFRLAMGRVMRLIQINDDGDSSLVQTRCSAIAERPCCRVRYSFHQKNWELGDNDLRTL